MTPRPDPINDPLTSEVPHAPQMRKAEPMTVPKITASGGRPTHQSDNGHGTVRGETHGVPGESDENGAVGRSRDHADKEVRSSVSLIIPAKNEARNLAAVLTHLPNCVDEVILVDGRSSDVTRLMAQTCRPDIRIIGEPEPGKGHALRAGFAAASCEVVIAMDADGSMLPEEIPQLVYFLDHGYDFVKGSRFVGGGGSLDITLVRKLGNRFLLLLANMWFDARLTDLCYGFFGFRRQYLDHLGLCSSGFEIETELTVRAVISGLRIAEVPSLELPRRSGRSNLRSFRDGLRVLQTLLEERAAQHGRAGGARVTPVSTGADRPG